MRAGEVVGLGGLVGSGRTELLRLIYGLDRPDEGEVLVDGKRLPPGRPDRAIAAGLGLAPEDRKSQGLLLDWSLTKNVSLADLGRFQRGLLERARRARARRASSCARSTPCPTTPTASCASCPAATSRRSCWRAGCCTDCRVLLLDEPTRGVDVATKAELYRVITDLAREGVAVLVVSSELGELVGICSRILVMREGELVFEVDGAAANERELLRHAVAPTDSADLIEEVR